MIPNSRAALPEWLTCPLCLLKSKPQVSHLQSEHISVKKKKKSINLCLKSVRFTEKPDRFRSVPTCRSSAAGSLALVRCTWACKDTDDKPKSLASPGLHHQSVWSCLMSRPRATALTSQTDFMMPSLSFRLRLFFPASSPGEARLLILLRSFFTRCHQLELCRTAPISRGPPPAALPGSSASFCDVAACFFQRRAGFCRTRDHAVCPPPYTGTSRWLPGVGSDEQSCFRGTKFHPAGVKA